MIINYRFIFPFLMSCFLCLQKTAKVVTIDSYEDVPQNDEGALKKALANQPISVAIEAGGRAFQLYTSVRIMSFKITSYCKDHMFRLSPMIPILHTVILNET